VTRGELLFAAGQFDRAPLCQRDVRRVVRCDVRAAASSATAVACATPDALVCRRSNGR